MTLEEYHQLDTHFAHCTATYCKQTDITCTQSCPLFTPDCKKRFAWGIYGNVQTADLKCVRHEVVQ